MKRLQRFRILFFSISTLSFFVLLKSYAISTKEYNNSHINKLLSTPSELVISDKPGQQGQTFRFAPNTKIKTLAAKIENNVVYYKVEVNGQTSKNYWIRGSALAQLSHDFDGCDELPANMTGVDTQNIRNIVNLSAANVPTSFREARVSAAKSEEHPDTTIWRTSASVGASAWGKKIAAASYGVAGLCTNTTANYRKPSYVSKRIGQENCRAKPGGKCFAAVKAALIASGVTSEYLTGVSAKFAHTQGILTRAGFKTVKNCSSTTAPIGAILVYSGGKHGHIEVNTGKGFCSDFCKSQPIDRYARRKLLACYVK